MSFSETIFLFFLALIIFGPKKLPEIARQVGKYLNEFKRASNEFRAQIEQEIAHLETEKPQILPPSRAPEGATSRNGNNLSATLPAAEAPATLAAPAEADVSGMAQSSETSVVATEAISEAAVSNSSSQESQQESHA